MHLVGGIYEKDGVKGFVHYIDEDRGIMQIHPCTAKEIFDNFRTTATYWEGKRALEAKGWRYPTIRELRIFRTNSQQIRYNFDSKVYSTGLDVYREVPVIIWSCEFVGKNRVYSYVPVLDDVSPAPIRDDNYLSYFGVRDVPLEPQYVHSYYYPNPMSEYIKNKPTVGNNIEFIGEYMPCWDKFYPGDSEDPNFK